MDKSNRIPQLYGYTVCLVAVVAFLLSAHSAVTNAFAMSNPLIDRWGGPETLTSFEAYKVTHDRSLVRTGDTPAPPPLSEEQLRRQYDVLRTDQIARVRYNALRDLTASLLVVLISIALFVTHWRWLRARAAEEAMAERAITP